MDTSRRDFFKKAAIALGAAPTAASAAPAELQLRNIHTDILNIAFREVGPKDGLPIILLHGFPDDASAYDNVALALAENGHRVIAPYSRGFGPTTFVDPEADYTAQQAAIAQDVIDFADALKVPRFVICGYDWGCRAANIVCALHPSRVRAAVFIGGYAIQNTLIMGPPAPPAVLKLAWFQWFFNTERGRRDLEQNRKQICKFLWQEWSPTWRLADTEFEAMAPSLDNPSFVDCVIHSYRHRTLNAPGEPRFEDVERHLATRPKINVPSILLYGADSGFGSRPAAITAQEQIDFPKLLDRRIIRDAGHFVPREQPSSVVSSVLDAIRATIADE